MYPARPDSFRFGREYRLRSDLKIREILNIGKRFSGRYLDVRYVSCDDALLQFCIKTPKALGNAVCRNRVKRVIRNELRTRMDRFKAGIRAVIIVRRLPVKNMTSELTRDLLRLLDDA